MKTHIINNGIVVNTILATVAEAQAAYPDAMCIDGTDGGIGWTWDGITLTPPPVIVQIPQSVTRFQARGALLLAGLLDDVETAMAACSDEMAKLAWQYAQEFKRDSPTIAVMATAIGIDDAKLDDLFRVAVGIDA